MRRSNVPTPGGFPLKGSLINAGNLQVRFSVLIYREAAFSPSWNLHLAVAKTSKLAERNHLQLRIITEEVSLRFFW